MHTPVAHAPGSPAVMKSRRRTRTPGAPSRGNVSRPDADGILRTAALLQAHWIRIEAILECESVPVVPAREGGKVAFWLFKEEPANYSYADLERDGSAVWGGVTNALARQHLRTVAVGDRVFYYHTGKEKAVVGGCTSWPAQGRTRRPTTPRASPWRSSRCGPCPGPCP